MKKFIRNPVVRLVICLVICVSLVSLNVIYPLTLPAQASVPFLAEALAWVTQGILISLGVSLSFNYEGTTEAINAVVFDLMDDLTNDSRTITPMTEAGEKLVALWEQQDNDPLFDAPIDTLTIDMPYADWLKLETVASAWLASYLVPSGGDEPTYTIQVPTSGGEVFLKKEDAFQGDLYEQLFAVNDWSETFIRTHCGKSLVYFGHDTGVLYGYINSRGQERYRSTVTCDHYGGNGSHVYWFDSDSNGNVSGLFDGCGNCGRNDPSSVCFLAFHTSGVSQPSDRDYQYVAGEVYRDGSHFYGVSLPGRVLFDRPIVGVVGSTSIPVEKDDRFAPGIVTGAWGDLIGKVGDIATSLPLTFPTSPAGFQDLSQSGATSVFPDVLTKDIVGEVDVPAEGDVNLPDVGDLKLPATIATKFPFCIPFDAVKGLSLLSATPVAPTFRIPFKFGDRIDYSIDIDFDRFSGLIGMIRWFERAIFIAILMVNTRKFIKW